MKFLLLGVAVAVCLYAVSTTTLTQSAGEANFCCYYFHNESASMFSHHYYQHYEMNTRCQYTIDVKDPDLRDNCDLVLCIKDLDLDIGDAIRINHRDIQVQYRGKKTPSYPIRIWDHKVTFWFTSDMQDKDSEASWAMSYKCLERGKDHDLCNICDELNEKAVLPKDEKEKWYRLWS